MAPEIAAKSFKVQLFANQSSEMTHFDALWFVLGPIWYIVYFTHTNHNMSFEI